MTILALRCIVKDHRHRNLQHSIRRPSISLARQQQFDGGFGNLYNTALTMQVCFEVRNDVFRYKSRVIQGAARCHGSKRALEQEFGG